MALPVEQLQEADHEKEWVVNSRLKDQPRTDEFRLRYRQVVQQAEVGIANFC